MAARARTHNRGKRMTYIRDIPLINRQKLCRILDVPGPGSNWKQLAALLGFSADDCYSFEKALYMPGGSPSDEMLKVWDFGNHTITELYDKLYQMNHARGMMLLKDYVDAAHKEKIKKVQGEQPDENNDETTATIPLSYQPHKRRQPTEGIDTSEKLHAGHPSDLPPGVSYQQDLCLDHSSSTVPDMKPPADPIQRPHPATNQEAEASATSSSPWKEPPSPNSQTGASNTVVNTDQRQHPQRFNQEEVLSNLDNGTQKQIHSPVVQPGNYNTDRKRSDDNNDADTAKPPAPMSRKEQERRQRLTVLSSVISMKYEDIQKATQCFSDSYKLGSGSFGTVYYMVHMNTKYAIKRLHQDEDPAANAARFSGQMKEITALATYRHKNIVTLCFNCTDGPEPCLGYEYMSNGSLEDNLQCRGPHKQSLDWERRKRIALGAATGLFYLHHAQDQPLIHGDIKSANILLDKWFEPKIGDFGLARYGSANGNTTGTLIKTSKLYGTMPYLPKDFLRSFKLSVKVDVYSFGIVLMEILTGEKAADEKREPKTRWLIHIVIDLVESLKNDRGYENKLVDELCDKRCPDWPWDIAWQMLELALECVHVFPQRRPVMEEVVKRLQDINDRIAERNELKKRSIPTQNTEPLGPTREPEESCYDSNELTQQNPRITPSTPQQNTDNLSPLERKFRDCGITNPIPSVDQPGGSADLLMYPANTPLHIPSGPEQYRPPPHMPQDLRSVSQDSNITRQGQVPGSTPQQSFPTGTSSTVPSSFMNRPTPPSTATPPSTNPPVYDSFYEDRHTGPQNYRHHDQGQNYRHHDQGQYPSGTHYGDYPRPPVSYYQQHQYDQYLQQQQQQQYHQQQYQQERFQGDPYLHQQQQYNNYQHAHWQYRESSEYGRPPQYTPHFNHMDSINPANFTAAPPTPSPDQYTGMHDTQMAKLDRTQLPMDNIVHRGPGPSRATSMESRNTQSPAKTPDVNQEARRQTASTLQQQPSYVDFPDSMHTSQHSAVGTSNRAPMQQTDVIPTPGLAPDTTEQEPAPADVAKANRESPMPSEGSDIISPMKQLHLNGVTTESTDTQEFQQPESVKSVDASWDGERKRPVPTQHTDKLTTQELHHSEPSANSHGDQSQYHSVPAQIGRPSEDVLSLNSQSRVPTQKTEPIG